LPGEGGKGGENVEVSLQGGFGGSLNAPSLGAKQWLGAVISAEEREGGELGVAARLTLEGEPETDQPKGDTAWRRGDVPPLVPSWRGDEGKLGLTTEAAGRRVEGDFKKGGRMLGVKKNTMAKNKHAEERKGGIVTRAGKFWGDEVNKKGLLELK